MGTIRKRTQARPAASLMRMKAKTTAETFTLRLYVAGQTAKSIRAFANLKVICDTHLKGRYQIEVIDLLEHPEMARGDQIVAVPTLEIKLPQSVQRIIGDLSNTDRVLVGLALQKID